jgi:hypothetical protein
VVLLTHRPSKPPGNSPFGEKFRGIGRPTVRWCAKLRSVRKSSVSPLDRTTVFAQARFRSPGESHFGERRSRLLCRRRKVESPGPVLARYDIRPDAKGWTVFDVWTGKPVVIASRRQEGLTLQEADTLAVHLSRRASARVREILQ